MNVAVCTASAGNYAPMAQVMAGSFRRLHPDVPVLFGLSDRRGEELRAADEPFEIVTLDELAVPQGLAFRYPRRELAIALKPFLLQHALDRGFDAAVYIDVDVLVLGDLSDLLAAAGRSTITLVPHLLEPPAGPDRVTRELTILQSGIFNGGVLAVRESPEARAFLSWWQERLAHHCRHSVDEGLHYDQRWLDLVPSYYEGVAIYADPTVNVAHWNLPERDVAACRLFHLSGYEPDRPEVLTRYSRRLSFSDVPEVEPIFHRFREAVLSAGWREAQARPYGYGRFDNGVAITDAARASYRDLGVAAGRFGDPFRTEGAESFFHWLTGAAVV